MTTFISARNVALTLLCALTLTACGGGGDSGSGDETTGGDGGGSSGPTNEKPSASIVYPPLSSVSFADTVTIRGTADDDSSVVAVAVNGVAATSSDGFATWTATVPLTEGENALVVSVEDDEGETTSAADSVSLARTLPPYDAPTGVKIDTVSNRAVILSLGTSAIDAVNLSHGEREILSSANVGSGPIMGRPLNLDINSAGDTAYVADYDGAIYQVNLATGDRELLSSNDRGTGPSLEGARDVALDSVGNRLFVVTTAAEYQLIEVDLTTGDRTLRYKQDISLSEYFLPLAVEWNATTSQVFVADAYETIAVFDGTTFTKSTPVTDNSVIDGLAYDLGIDEASGVVYILTNSGLYDMPLATGIVAVVADETVGVGNPLRALNALDIDSPNGRLIVADTAGSAVLEVDTDTGDRATFADDSESLLGTGPRALNGFFNLADTSRNAGFQFDNYSGAIVKVDFSSGNRSLLNDAVDATADAGALDPTTGDLIRVKGRLVERINGSTGEVTTLAQLTSSASGFEENFERVFGAVVDPANNRLLVVAREPSIANIMIIEVSLADGSETLLFNDPCSIQDDRFRDPAQIAMDTANERLIFVDSFPVELRSFQLNNSTCVDIALSGSPGQPEFDSWQGMKVATDGIVYAFDEASGRLARFDIDATNGEYVAGFGEGSGSYFQQISALAVDEAGGIAHGVATDMTILFDLETGENVMISR